jgi:hypothetical protein
VCGNFHIVKATLRCVYAGNTTSGISHEGDGNRIRKLSSALRNAGLTVMRRLSDIA